MAQKCEICDRQTDFFDGVDYGDKCVFHCDKSDEAKWGNPESEDVKRFWRAVQTQIIWDVKNATGQHHFARFAFPVLESTTSLEFQLETNLSNSMFNYKIRFSNIKFLGDVNFYFSVFKKEITLSDDTFEQDYYFGGCIFEDHVVMMKRQLLDAIGDDKIYFLSNVYILGSHNTHNDFFFRNMIFSGNLSLSGDNAHVRFYDVTFDSYTKISTGGIVNVIKFDNVALLEKAIVGIKNIDCNKFVYTNSTCNAGRLEFVSLKINELMDIENSSLKNIDFIGLSINKNANVVLDNVSFNGAYFSNVMWGNINEDKYLGFDEKPLDRQIARQLKSINDAQGETVIANDFYALEMRLRSKELNWREHFGEKLVQNIHGLVSNHSNDWALPTIWFFVFGLLFATLAKYSTLKEIVFALFIGIGGLIVFADKIPTKNYILTAIGVLAVSLIVFVDSGATFEFVAALINPLNFKDSKDLLGGTNLVLIYACRIIEVFIGYQIITAIRKNTRRK